MPQQFEFSPSFLLAAITARHFAVPQYQRSYSWNEQNLEDFWFDMQRSITEGGEYFLGSFVLSREDSADYHSIIDGQQRIATTTILLACMRDAYKSNDRADLAKSFDLQFLQQHDVVNDEYRRRLRLNAIDDPFYSQRILAGEDVQPSAASHEKLLSAKAYFENKLSELIFNNPNNWAEKLKSITKYLQTQARVVVVETASDADAYTIFETLNDRGADLTIADLLKNYLLSRAKAEIEAVSKLWFDAIAILDDVQSEKDFVHFLRQLWSSFYGVTRERDLYRSIKQKIQSPKDTLNFAKKLKEGAIHYRAILSPESDYWSGYEQVTRDHMAVLGGFNLQQVRPLLLAVLSTLPKPEVISIVKNLTSWGVRGIVAGSSGGGQVERYFTDSAVAIRSAEVSNAEQLLISLLPVVPNDSVFQNAFRSMRVTKNSQARYYLCAIEKHLEGKKDPELILNEDAQQVNLEHILPQNPSKGTWEAFSADEAAAYAYRLGNMTLLRRSENQKLGNGEWPEKRAVLQQSQLKLNKQLIDNDAWEKETIEDRQQALANLALQVWPQLS
jgi:hypothetical protein